MATGNFSFEKRRREMAKKEKKAAKLQRKLNGPAPSSDDDATPTTEGDADSVAEGSDTPPETPTPTA